MSTKRKKMVWIISIILLLMVPTAVVLASEFSAGNNTAAQDTRCAECEGYDYELKFDGNDLVDPKTKTAYGNSITIKNFDYKEDDVHEIMTFDWTSTVGIGLVVVKAGDDGSYTQTYDFATSGSEATQNNKGLSNVTFCWNNQPSRVIVNVGACTWTAEGGSTRSVSLDITGASVTITKSGGGTYGPYTSSQNINLPAGSYTYTYTAAPGYSGTSTGTFTVDECPVASVIVSPQICVWDPVLETSSTDVTLTIDNATLTISGPNAYQESFTSSQTINLPPGSYSYSWTANSGYAGSGSSGFTLDDCAPKVGSADVVIGACEWDGASGSWITVTLTLEDASFTIDGQTYTASTDIKLSPGNYAYSWVGTGDSNNSGSGSITIFGCEPASVTVNVDVCEWIDEVSMNDVILAISGATLTIYQDSVEVGTYTNSQTIALPAGDYTYIWTANQNYTGSGSGSFRLIDCEPGKGDATVNVGACEWDAINGSMIKVTITLDDAALTIDGTTYTESTEIKLSPGTYAYSWVSTGDNEGSGNGSITIYGCEPASVTVDLGGCEWDGSKSVTDVTLNISGASLIIFQAGVEVGTYTTSQTISLNEGVYSYTWAAIDQDHTGSGSGSFTLMNCEPGVAYASISLGACVFANEISLTPATITLNFAVLTINGKTYEQWAIIQLEPGEYFYNWEASDEDHEGEGSGTLIVEGCPKAELDPEEPKEVDSPEEEDNPQEEDDPMAVDAPDLAEDTAAGGQGPSLFFIFTPILAVFAALLIAWSTLKNKVMKNH